MFGKKKNVRVRSMIFRDGMWSTNSTDTFASLKEADERYKQIAGQWQGQISQKTFTVELIDYNDHSHDKSAGI